MAACTVTQEAGPSAMPSEFLANPAETASPLVLRDRSATLEAPPNAVEAVQKWNSPKINTYRVFSCFCSFFIFGMSDGSYGVLVPFLENYYDLTYTVVSLIFLSPFLGYTCASLVNESIHIRFGRRGVAILAPACHLASFIILAVHPPYPVLVINFILVGFGNGLIDGAWSAWFTSMANANQLSGFLQGCYPLGAMVSPLIATALVHKQNLGWWTFHYIMITLSVMELMISTLAFWKHTGTVYQAENPRSPNAKSGRTREALSNKVTWVFALYVFGYCGAEVSLGGWIVSFMTSVRHANSLTAASTSTGFWAGMTAGRMGLPLLTAYLGEFRAVCLYLSITIGFELIFWLVPSLVVSAVAVALLGFFMGPLFPTGVIMVTKLLPKSLHVGTISFSTALGGSGGAIFPFAVGALAQSKGVKTLQPVTLALFAVVSGLWLLLPRQEKKKRDEDVELDNRRV